MAQPSSFIFKQIDVDAATGLVRFGYAVRFADDTEKTFEEQIRFTNTTEDMWNAVPKKTLQKMLTNLHIACGVSYYKAYCPKKIEIDGLAESEATFWNSVYTKGLGEFFFKNQIDFRGLVQFPSSEKSVETPETFEQKDRSLVPFGGGKDSLVSVELLKYAKKTFALFMLNPVPLQLELAKKVGVNMILVERTLDPELLRLSKEGSVFNGHVPISTIYLFTSILAAALHDFKYVVFSNEASANIGNVEYLGEEINHQWSKSLEAEMLIRDHIQKTITEDITPFSLLRPFSELEITGDFIRHPEYFPLFSSCNRNFAITENRRLKGETPWCGECPKCAFVFLMLAAYLKPETLTPIFGKNLFEDEKLLPTYRA